MRQFLESNADTVAIVTGLALAIIITLAYAYSVSDIAGSFDTAINPKETSSPAPTYNLEAAAQLDLKGLTPGR